MLASREIVIAQLRRLLVVILSVSLAGALAIPNVGMAGGETGARFLGYPFALGPNAAAWAAAFVLIAGVVSSPRSGPLWILHFSTLISLVVIVLSESRSFLFGVILALTAWSFSKKRSRHVVFQRVAALLGVAALALVSIPVLVDGLQARSEATGGDVTTGRLASWEIATEFSRDAPLVGQGFYITSRELLTEAKISPLPQTSFDNEFLEVAASSGIPAALIHFSLWLGAAGAMIAARRNSEEWWLVGLALWPMPLVNPAVFGVNLLPVLFLVGCPLVRRRSTNLARL
jgi:hypothetical protein